MQILLGGKVMEKQMTDEAKKLFEEISLLVAENFVAIYEKKDGALIIRSVGGKAYRLSLEEC